MLKFHGHTFTDSARCTCCIGDARVLVVDPTNTRKIRAQFRAALRQRWNQLRELTKLMIKERDLLALKSGGMTQVHAVVASSSKIDQFQSWFDFALNGAVLQKDGSFMRTFLSEGYKAGTQFGQLQAKTQMTHLQSGHRERALVTLARVELQGIMEAVSQQAVRAVSQALLTNTTQMKVVRSILNIIEKVGVVRSNAMVELLVVRAHAEASLDVYEASGLKAVGLLPESRAQAKVVTDAEKAQQTSKVKAQGADAKGPGSRSSRKRTPSARTIRRIRAASNRLASALGANVNVRTAGDNDVCPVCEAISENGPYSIDTARSLIPAHAHCRCVFVPASDARFAGDTRGVRGSHALESSPAG